MIRTKTSDGTSFHYPQASLAVGKGTRDNSRDRALRNKNMGKISSSKKSMRQSMLKYQISGKMVIKNRKGDEAGPISASIGTIIFLLVGVILAVALVASAGLQTSFLCTITGSCPVSIGGEQLVVAHDKSSVTIIGNPYAKKPVSFFLGYPSGAIYDVAVGNFRREGPEVVVLGNAIKAGPYTRLEALGRQETYAVVEDISENTNFDKSKCTIERILPADIRGQGRDDLALFSFCRKSADKNSALEKVQLYLVQDINKYDNFPAFVREDFDLKDVFGFRVTSGDFNADGRTDFAFLRGTASGISISILTDTALSKKEQAVYYSNVGIVNLIAGNFTGSPHSDIILFAADGTLTLFANPLSVGGSSSTKVILDPKKVADRKYASSLPDSRKIATGDFDGDKSEDIAIGVPAAIAIFSGDIFLISRLDTDSPEVKAITPPPAPRLSEITSVTSGKFG